MIVRCILIVTTVVLSFATVSTQAQVSIDVSRITCDEYVHDKIPTSDFISFSAVGPLPLEARSMLSRWLIANWLSGYYHAKRNNSIIDLESPASTNSKGFSDSLSSPTTGEGGDHGCEGDFGKEVCCEAERRGTRTA